MIEFPAGRAKWAQWIVKDGVGEWQINGPKMMQSRETLQRIKDHEGDEVTVSAFVIDQMLLMDCIYRQSETIGRLQGVIEQLRAEAELELAEYEKRISEPK